MRLSVHSVSRSAERGNANSASGNQTIVWGRRNVTPPQSSEELEKLIETLAQHLTERYGTDEVRNRYVEVWNERYLNGFQPAGHAAYFMFNEHTASATKRVDTEYRVGGPATAGFGWIQKMLNYCGQYNVPIDIIATHGYSAMEGFPDGPGRGETTLALSKMHDQSVPGDGVDE